jgi:hypothetical protein
MEVERIRKLRMAVQKGAVLNTIWVTKMGRYWRLNTMQVNPTSPAIDLNNTRDLSSLGTSSTIFLPKYLTVPIEMTKLTKVLTKHNSIAPTPVFVPTLAIP